MSVEVEGRVKMQGMVPLALACKLSRPGGFQGGTDRFGGQWRMTGTSSAVRTNLANRPTEPMLVSLRARYTKLWGNRGFLQSGSRQTTPVRVGVTCGSGISVVRVGRE